MSKAKKAVGRGRTYVEHAEDSELRTGGGNATDQDCTSTLLINGESAFNDLDVVEERRTGGADRHTMKSINHCLRLLEKRCKGGDLAETSTLTEGLQILSLLDELAVASSSVVRDRAFEQSACNSGTATNRTWICSVEATTVVWININRNPPSHSACRSRVGRRYSVVSWCEGVGDRRKLRASRGGRSVQEDVVNPVQCVRMVPVE